MDWAERTEPNHPQLADFEDLTGWQVRCSDGADAKLLRSKQEQCFGEYTARVEYTGTSPSCWLRIEPPEPIAIPDTFTGVNLWVRGNNWSFVETPAPERAHVAVYIEDAKGETYRIALHTVTFDYWCVMHQTLVHPATGTLNSCVKPQGNADGVIDHPARFLSIECLGFQNQKTAHLHFDALSFYEIPYAPLEFEPIPENLPWPTTPDTILPSLKGDGPVPVPEPGATAEGGYAWISAYAGKTIRFTYTPKDGSLSDITVEAEGQTFHPCWRGGIRFETPHGELQIGDPGLTPRCEGVRRDGDAIVADWTVQPAEGDALSYRYTFRVKGKSLIVDVTAPGGRATRFDIGLAKGLDAAKAVYIPYLTYGGDWPRVACSPTGDTPLFVSALIDYYNSDASELFGAPQIRDDDALGYAGGSIHKPKTDGQRNDLRERVFINISHDVHEVLPSIPNPTCDTGEMARECVWRNVGQPEEEMLDRYKAYGIDKFIACHHEVGWRDAGESFTMRLKAAPRIGDEGLARYGRHLREDLGYRFGTYTNYVDFAPVNSNWNEDDVCLDPDGSWQTAWPRCYALKPLRAAEKEAYYAPRIHEKFGTTAQYCDVHTAYTPWGRTDYDARTPGAGMFRTQFNAFARLLWNESKAHHGPVFSEGNYHWFYAGIVDGDYATMMPYGGGWQVPPIVDFDLLKMHPKMTDFGMGFANMFYGERGEWSEDGSRLSPYFDRFITSTIAFGHLGFLTYEWDFAATLKSYYMVQALQQRYIMVPVDKIGYSDGQGLVDTSTAIATDAHLRRQVHVRYENGLETWCNLSFDQDWTVSVGDREYLLPPGGFVAQRPGDILAYSAVLDNARHEFVHCNDYLYLDSRDGFVRTPSLAARGQVAVKRDGNDAWWIIPCPDTEEVTVSTDWLGRDAGYRFSATAYDMKGNRLGECEIRRGGNEVTVMPYAADEVKYRLSAEPAQGLAGAQWRIEVPRHVATNGEAVAISATVALPEGLAPSDCTGLSGRPLTGERQAAAYPLSAPLEITGDEYHRFWIELPIKGPDVAEDSRWIDIWVVPAFEVNILSDTVPVQQGVTTTIEADIVCHLAEKTEVTCRAEVPDGWRVDPAEQSIPFAPEEVRRAVWGIEVSPEPAVEPLVFRFKRGERVFDVARYLSVRPSEWVAADLIKLPREIGVAIRGSGEGPLDMSLTGAYVNATVEAVGEESKPSLFMHPPYQTGVGYTFASIAVDLPEGKPFLEFDMGFSNSSTTQDGCVFKVVIIDGKQEHEVFSEQYAQLGQWKHGIVELTRFAGKSLIIKLISDVGPADNSYSDWSCWGEPRITLGAEVLTLTIHDEKPCWSVQAPPLPIKGLTKADLSRIASAELTFESAGVNVGEHTSYIDINGIEIGTTPSSGSDTEWQSASVPLSPEAIGALKAFNRLEVRNPGQDFMKLRNFCLHFTLDDGRQGASWVEVGPYTSAIGWLHGDGICVPIGATIKVAPLVIPLGQ